MIRYLLGPFLCIVSFHCCWLFWLSCQYLPSDWLQRFLWWHLYMVRLPPPSPGVSVYFSFIWSPYVDLFPHGHTQYIFHTPMARYIAHLWPKVPPLNVNKLTNHPSTAMWLTSLALTFIYLLSCAKSHMLSASRRQPHLLHVSAVDRRQTWSMAKSWRCVTLSGFLHSHIVRCRWNPISCGTHYSGSGLSENDSALTTDVCEDQNREVGLWGLPH